MEPEQKPGTAFEDGDPTEEKTEWGDRWPDELLEPLPPPDPKAGSDDRDRRLKEGLYLRPLRPDVRLGGSLVDDTWFLYRPGELLVSTDVERQLLPLLRKLQARRVEWRCLLEARGVDTTGTCGAELHLSAYRVPPARDVPTAVALLRRDLPEEQQHLVGPNHVVVGSSAPGTVELAAGELPAPMYGAPYINGGGGGPASITAAPAAGSYPGARGLADGAGLDIAIVDNGYYWRVRPSVLPPARGDQGVIDANHDNVLDREAGHADFVAGLLYDVAPRANLLYRKALDSFGVGDEVSVANAIIGSPATTDIYNLSLGGYTQGNLPPLAIVSALRGLDASDVVACAAGNNAKERKFWPAALSAEAQLGLPPLVLGVGAVKPDSAGGYVGAQFTNFGKWVTCSSRGVRRVSTFVPDPGVIDPDVWAEWSGTSFSTPIVAGTVAAVASRLGRSARDAWDDMVRQGPGTLNDLGYLIFPPMRSIWP